MGDIMGGTERDRGILGGGALSHTLNNNNNNGVLGIGGLGIGGSGGIGIGGSAGGSGSGSPGSANTEFSGPSGSSETLVLRSDAPLPSRIDHPRGGDHSRSEVRLDIP